MTLKESAAVIALVAAAFAFPLEAGAQEIGAPPLAAAELEEMRGGFVLPTGVEIDFGAIARTYSNGVLMLETRFTWSPNGIVREDVLTSPQLASAEQLTNGFVMEDASGATVFAHQVDDSGVRNVLLNQADGRDIRIDTQLMVTLPGFDVTQLNFSAALAALRVFDDIQAGP